MREGGEQAGMTNRACSCDATSEYVHHCNTLRAEMQSGTKDPKVLFALCRVPGLRERM